MVSCTNGRSVISCCRRKDCTFDEGDVIDCSITDGIESPQETLKECSVTQPFATPGTPTENAVCEVFFSRMKYEALYSQTYLSIEKIDEEVGKYIDYYNNRRLHRRLNFKSPADVELAYCEGLKA